MAALARSDSLLDDPSFAAELARLEIRVPHADSAYEWDDHVSAARAFFAQLPGPEADPESDAPTVHGSRGRIVVGVAGFLVMMGVGAALAVLVWADRVATLLR